MKFVLEVDLGVGHTYSDIVLSLAESLAFFRRERGANECELGDSRNIVTCNGETVGHWVVSE